MNNPSRNFRLVIAYDGTEFKGWQRQRNARTIQGDIENCLRKMVQEDVTLHGAGRTDAGVHADGMVAHFKTKRTISAEDFHQSLNSMLPGSIRIIDIHYADDDFHARFSAKGKHYRYSLFTGTIQPPNKRLYSVHVRARLNLQIMRSCLSQLKGTHDFSSFENSGSRDRNYSFGRGAVRTLSNASLTQINRDFLAIDFIGDGFLRHMVRNMVGTLLESGRERLTVNEFKKILEARDRNLGGFTAPPQGLTLVKVLYRKFYFFMAECLASRDCSFHGDERQIPASSEIVITSQNSKNSE